jgi:glycosyltransferase involved in cell wall biosynthesis
VTMIPVAFYAPLKSPLHPEPSGDRTMARLLMAALRGAGFAPGLASELRTLDRVGDAAAQERLRASSEEEARHLIERWRDPAQRPRLWFTYHVYYKAPDWIGPYVAGALGIPYVVAEGSRAGKRAGGPWALGHAGAEAALDRADLVFVVAPQDRVALERARPPRQALVDLPPFLDDAWTAAPCPGPRARAEPALLAVAMMRPGDKLTSYTLLAEALGRVASLPWTLDVVGDGPARPAVEDLLRPLGGRVRLHGRVADPDRLRDLCGAADLLVWPAVNEAYGMALLEAQSQACPVLAGAFGGVAGVVRDGETGVLAPPGDAAALAEALRGLILDAPRRARLGAAARAFVRGERSLAGASARLRDALAPLVGNGP